MSLAQPKRILVIKLRHHGDVLLATPVVHALKTRFPDCEIDMLVYRETADIISDNPEIAEIFTIDRSWKKQGLKTQLCEEKKLFSRLKKRRYDWALTCPTNGARQYSPNSAHNAASASAISNATTFSGVGATTSSTPKPDAAATLPNII